MKGYVERQDVHRARVRNTAIFSLLLMAFTTAAILWSVSLYQHSYSSAKWHEDVKHRYRIVGDMLEDNHLLGMSEAEVVDLLGEEDCSEARSFKQSRKEFQPESTLIYYLGADILEDQWLIVSLDEETVVDYCIDWT